jgi:hypothetical protein
MTVSASLPPDARAAAWFSAMLLAAGRGDYRDAANAQSELKDLGWRVEPVEKGRKADSH